MFAGFLEARCRALPTEADCPDFIAERSAQARGIARAAPVPGGLSSHAARWSSDGGLDWRQPGLVRSTTPPVERCPARFRAARAEYLGACRRRGTPRPASRRSSAPRTSSSPTSRRSVGRPSRRCRPGTGRVLGPASAPGYARRRPGRCVRRWLTSCATCTRTGRSGTTWRGGSRRSAIPGAASRLRIRGRLTSPPGLGPDRPAVRDRETRLRDGVADRQARCEGRRPAPLGARVVRLAGQDAGVDAAQDRRCR